MLSWFQSNINGYLVIIFHTSGDTAQCGERQVYWYEGSGLYVDQFSMLISLDLPQCHFWQVGTPAGREQYIHRLGRTGRAGKEGRGLLLLMPWEKVFLRSLKDISITESKAPQMTSAVEAKVTPFLVRGLLCCVPSIDHLLCMCENVFLISQLKFGLT